MAKIWINPNFKDKLKEETDSIKKAAQKQEKISSLPKKLHSKLSPQTRKIIHSENYFNKRIKENSIVEFTFINNMTITGSIEWFDQRYIKILEAKTGDHILIDRRPIKYIKKNILE
jgi:hypothetical protein